MAVDTDGYDDLESPTHEPIDAAVYDDRPAEVRTEHSAEQTIVCVETQCGTVTAAIDVGTLSLANELQLARDVRAAFDRATTPGGDE